MKNYNWSRNDFTTGCLLGYNYFKKHYKKIAIDLSKPPALDADPKALQQINFTGNLDGVKNIIMLFLIEEEKRNHFRFFTRNCQSTVNVVVQLNSSS